MPNFIYGSSNIPVKTVSNISGLTGATGPTGPIGVTGNTGPDKRGSTGNTGPSLIFISKDSNNYLQHYFNDNTIINSTGKIQGITGNFQLQIAGTSLDIYNVLKSDLNNQLYTRNDGSTYTVDMVTFRNISTNSNPYITIVENDGKTIEIKYNLIGISFLGISGGSNGQLLKNTLGNYQTGETGTAYNTSSKTIDAQASNITQRFLITTPSVATGTSNQVKYWEIDPSIGNAFYLSPTTISSGNASTSRYFIVLKAPQNTNNSHSITIIIPPGNTTALPVEYATVNSFSDISNWSLKNISPVVWPLGEVPCFSSTPNAYTFLNFVSIGGIWYGNVIGFNITNMSSVGATFNNSSTTDRTTLYSCRSEVGTVFTRALQLPYGTNAGVTAGICCNSDCTISDTLNILCDGFFIAGLTSAQGTTFCGKLGACCLRDSNNKVLPCQKLKFCDCASIADNSGLQYSWYEFKNSKQSCLDFNCANALESFGACCDGNGNCQSLTKDQCISIGGYYQGDGINCISSKQVPVCYGGTGSCCDSGITCENSVYGPDCISNNKTYFGDGTSCIDFDCRIKGIPCYGIIPNETLNFGDIYENGMVCGIFNPKGTECFGNPIFGSNQSATYAELTEELEEEISCSDYKSIYDFVGYGFTGDSICDAESDSYIVLMSLHPITINESNEIVEYTGTSSDTTEFIWSHGGNYWGPLVNPFTGLVSELTSDKLNYKEGYIYDYTDENTKQNLTINSFIDCGFVRKTNEPSSWLTNNPNSSFNGKWFRNYGLMNTIRMVNSEYAYYYGLTGSNFTQTTYTPTQDATEITSARALSLFNKAYEETNNFISDWFIPSYDELAFIAKNCLSDSEDNVNAKLLQNGGTPMDGWYWSSTGTFDGTTNEYVLNHPSGLTHGTMSWAIKFDSDGLTDQFTTKKAHRIENKYKVRPIKLIRCDKSYFNNTSSDNKYWRITRLDENVIND